MNKFKKVLLGALSVLTLGLFVVTGTKVNASIVTESSNNEYCTYTVTKKTAEWEIYTGDGKFGSNTNLTSNLAFGMDGFDSSTKFNKNGYFVINAGSGVYIPVPEFGSGSISFTTRGTTDPTTLSLFDTDIISGENKSVTQSSKGADITINFSSSDIYEKTTGNFYIGLKNTGTKNYTFTNVKVELETDTYYGIKDDVTLTFEAQYNEEAAADSTKLRFIGTIEGIAYNDYANIKAIKFTFTFNKTSRISSVNKLYKSIVNGETTLKAAEDNKMYVIFQLNNINKTAYQSQKLTDCKFIVTFTDDSIASVDREDITLPTSFTTVVA